jgi:replicative DNA helicase
MNEPNLPPANIEAEEAILGGILFDPQAIIRIEAQLNPYAFYVSAHQEIYQVVLKLYHQGKPTDFITVSTYLSDSNRLDKVGGTAKLAQLLNRTVSAVNIDRYVDLVMDKFHRRKMIEVASKLPLYMNGNRRINIARITSECRQVKAKEGKLGLVIVDYLQMIASDTGGNRSYELGDVGRGLYQLAGELDVPVLALSQVSRGVEGRQNKRPMMSDLSQSGILEMVADNIIFAYRDEYYNSATSQPGILELILAKARHGDTGTVEVLFDKSSGLIRSLKEFD